LLDPGQVPDIETVTKWDGRTCRSFLDRLPAGELGNGSSEIPIVICFNRCGHVLTVGTEAPRKLVQEMAVDEGWIMAEW
ncbi:hypothetical protein K443DRAFT_41800, partial [Laccaria amethystina LaAM-08-1]